MSSPTGRRSTPSPAPRRDHAADDHAARAQSAGHTRRGARSACPIRGKIAGRQPVGPRRRAGSGPSVMLDDGEVERRVRLIRPMEHPRCRSAMMPQTHWQEPDRDSFARAGAEVAEFRSSQTARSISSSRVCCCRSGSVSKSRRGSIGCRPTRESASSAARSRAAWVAIALETGRTGLSPDAAFAALMDGKTILDLAEGLQLRRARVMGVNRIECPVSQT